MSGTCLCDYSVRRRGAPDPHYLCLPVLGCPHLSHWQCLIDEASALSSDREGERLDPGLTDLNTPISACYSSRTDRCFPLSRLSLFGLCGYRAGLRPGEESRAHNQPDQLACLPTWLLFLGGCGGYGVSALGLVG